jgi:hypothetical protein
VPLFVNEVRHKKGEREGVILRSDMMVIGMTRNQITLESKQRCPSHRSVSLSFDHIRMKWNSSLILLALFSALAAASRQADAFVLSPRKGMTELPATTGKIQVCPVVQPLHGGDVSKNKALFASASIAVQEEQPPTARSKLPVLQTLTFMFVLSTALTALAPPPALVAALGAKKATALLSMV